MTSRVTITSINKQQGLVLLTLVIVIVLAFTAYMVTELSVAGIKADSEKRTQMNLKKAKQAVIEYAISYADRAVGNAYGVLPHPETYFNGNDGNMASVGGAKNVNTIGWLPWRSLDISNLKDESGTCLYYVVSGSYKLHATLQADMINEDSVGMLRVRDAAGNVLQGLTPDQRVVALVIAPGSPLPTRPARTPTNIDSSCGRDYGNEAAYLEGNGVYDNATLSALTDTVDDFIPATATSSTEAIPYNDRFLSITRDEIWSAIVERSDFKQQTENLTRALAMCVANYANLAVNSSRRLPWPVKTDLTSADYRTNNSYSDDINAANGYSGRFPFNVDDSNNAINAAVLNIDNLFDMPGLCDSIDLGGGLIVDLKTAGSEYRVLWDNWKDHYFYALSRAYEPASSGAKSCASEPCITVNGNKYAGAVIFSGSRLPGVSRNNKAIVAEYLEDGKSNEFDNEAGAPAGNRDYVYTDPQTGTQNDIMYCIEDKATLTDDLTVSECT